MVQSRMLCRYGCGLWALLKQRLENRTIPRRWPITWGSCVDGTSPGLGFFKRAFRPESALAGQRMALSAPKGWKFEKGQEV